ncbi:MAG: sulfatase-like hydrolase/transferase [Bryobacteraceae bacterium]
MSGLAAAPIAGRALQAQERPNILFLITDQQSQSAMSSNGNPYLRTPAMDSLAADGVSFSESYATYPVCSPARSSWFTGRMPHETGVMKNGLPIKTGMPTMGEVFRVAGYQTVYGGKWHLPKSFTGATGFDELIGGSGRAAAMDEPLASACVNFLSQKPRQPFLLVASFMNPHDVCDWIRAHKGTRSHARSAEYPPAPRNMAVDPDEPEYIQFHRTAGYNSMSAAVGIAAEWKRDDIRYYIHSYYRLVESVDRQIERVLAALRQSGLDENTLVVLTSDHGEGMGAHRWVQKAAFWEETAKVPLVIAGHGVKRRGVRDEETLVSGLDVLPTICDYAGVPPLEGVRGSSLRAPVEGRPLDRSFVVSELADYGGEAREGRMLRTARYKYVVFNGGRRPEQLFDLQLDPGEVHNLARREDAAAVLKGHRAILAEWIRGTQDGFRMPVPG